MAVERIGWGALALAAALAVAGASPASAEFFGCKEPHTKISYSSGYHPKAASSRHATQAYAAAPRHQSTSFRFYEPRLTVRRADRW